MLNFTIKNGPKSDGTMCLRRPERFGIALECP